MLDRGRKGPKRSLLLGAEHQLRQPLNAVSLLIGELSQGASGRDLEAVMQDLRFALSLSNLWLDALVELEKVDQGLVVAESRDVALNEVFARLKEDFAARLELQGLAFRVVQSTQVVRSDPVLLKRILTILLDNAAKFTREGKILLGCRRRGDLIHVEVWDTGLGMASDEGPGVFEPYARLDNEVRPRERGLGVGLTLARKLASLSGQQIEVFSELGRGSCFSLTLRAVDRHNPEVPAARQHAVVPRNALDQARILLLEGADVEPLSAHFELWGARVQQVAATRATLAQGLEAQPALVVADERAFGACGGWDLLSDKQRAPAEAPGLILLSDQAEAVTNTPAGRESAMVFHILTRPVRPARLRALSLFALSPP